MITEDPEIKTLVSKYDVKFRQSFSGTRLPELMQYYTLTAENNSMSTENKENVINDFLATGKFKDEVREFEIVHTLIN